MQQGVSVRLRTDRTPSVLDILGVGVSTTRCCDGVFLASSLVCIVMRCSQCACSNWDIGTTITPIDCPCRGCGECGHRHRHISRISAKADIGDDHLILGTRRSAFSRLTSLWPERILRAIVRVDLNGLRFNGFSHVTLLPVLARSGLQTIGLRTCPPGLYALMNMSTW